MSNTMMRVLAKLLATLNKEETDTFWQDLAEEIKGGSHESYS